MNDKQNKTVKNLGYHVGMAFGVVVALCIMAILIAFTAKIILWIV